MREAELERYFRKAVRMVGGKTIKLAPTEAGVPDRLVMLPYGRMFLVELKTETGALSRIQKHWHRQVADIGITVYTLHGREQVNSWVAAVMDLTPRPPTTP